MPLDDYDDDEEYGYSYCGGSSGAPPLHEAVKVSMEPEDVPKRRPLDTPELAGKYGRDVIEIRDECPDATSDGERSPVSIGRGDEPDEYCCQRGPDREVGDGE